MSAIVLPEEDQCAYCGCTAFEPCMTVVGPCSWVKPGLCSACVEQFNSEDLDDELGLES